MLHFIYCCGCCMFSFGYSRIALQSKWRYGAIGRMGNVQRSRYNSYAMLTSLFLARIFIAVTWDFVYVTIAFCFTVWFLHTLTCVFIYLLLLFSCFVIIFLGVVIYVIRLCKNFCKHLLLAPRNSLDEWKPFKFSKELINCALKKRNQDWR